MIASKPLILCIYKESIIRFYTRQAKAFTEKKNKKLLKPQTKVYIKIKKKHDLNQCCGSGSGIQDPVSRWPLDPGWVKINIGMGKNQYRDRDEHPGSYFRELRNNFWVFGFLGFGLMRIRDPESFWPWIRVPGWKNLERDKHPGSATLDLMILSFHERTSQNWPAASPSAWGDHWGCCTMRSHNSLAPEKQKR